MSKNLVMGKSKEASYFGEYLMKLENDLLGEIFYSIKNENGNYPVLFKLVQDEYEDSEFDVTELPKLKAEIDSLLKTKKFSKEITTAIRKISDIAEEAYRTNNLLFAEAD